MLVGIVRRAWLVWCCCKHAYVLFNPLLFAAIKFYRPTDAYKFWGLSRRLASHIYVFGRLKTMSRIRNMLNTPAYGSDLKSEFEAATESEYKSMPEFGCIDLLSPQVQFNEQRQYVLK